VTQRPVGDWKKWTTDVPVGPRQVAHPETVDELASLITEAAQAGRTVKPVGSDHSFTEISATDGVQLHLDQLTGITDVDYDGGLITVLGGTSLAELNMSLAAHYLALENLGDTDRQTITGAISTGIHGTGAKFGGLATQVRGLTMITADGTQLHCSAVEQPELYAAARVGLGALGVISEVTLQCVPSFRLHAAEGPARLDEVLEGFDRTLTVRSPSATTECRTITTAIRCRAGALSSMTRCCQTACSRESIGWAGWAYH
jgi:FAD/FMN-containing dehydrogenase